MITQPLLGHVPFRFGSSMETGRHEASPTAQTPDSAGQNATYRSYKLFVGLTSRTGRNVLSGSYGIELGTSGDWQIRGNPFIRSVPANDFNGNGAGAERFVAYNLNVAYAVWTLPLLPRELSGNEEFTKTLEGQIVTASSLLQSAYLRGDPHFKGAAGMLESLMSELGNLRIAVDDTQATANLPAGDPVLPLFDSCTAAINTAERRARSAMESDGAEQYGLLLALLPDDEDRLNAVLDSCISRLNARIGNPSIEESGARLRNLTSSLIREFGLIDDRAAAVKADSEMTYVRRTLGALFDRFQC
jgi:hypothetical protein